MQGDMMELISEEELSVCRSEGSPPRKAKKGKVAEDDQEDMVINFKRKKDGGNSKKSQVGSVAGGNKNFKLKPEKVKD